MDDFETLLGREHLALERYIRFRIPNSADADDVLQETCIAAYEKFSQLKNPNSFKPWLLRIARNKCADCFRRKTARLEIPMEDLAERIVSVSRYGITAESAVADTLALLAEQDRRILRLYFWQELSQAEIARNLDIPVGTVKSRLHTAKRHFKNIYPYPPQQTKGDHFMGKLPEYLPEYKIEASPEAPFAVKWEELMGWFLVPRVGEKLVWGMYDFPQRKLGEWDEMEAVGYAEVHGIPGVEVRAVAHDPMDCNSEGGEKTVERQFIAQLTDTHCRYLAESHFQNGVRRCFTFLDGERFLDNWGFGEDNCGNETNLTPKGDILRKGDVITTGDKDFLLDIVGRYTVTIGGKQYDTVCVMDVETYNGGVVSEQFLDRNGKTILWRRFNRDDWKLEPDQPAWSTLLPDSQRITVNGETYVHWYDCITDYILD